jgi:two-component system response regulator HydG
VRELENVIQRTVVMRRGATIEAGDIVFSGAVASRADGKPAVEATPQLANRTLEEVERVSILATLEAARGNKAEAARRLGVTPRTLSNKMKLWRSNGLVA